MINEANVASRKAVTEERVATCAHFGCGFFKKIKPLKRGRFGFGKHPKCSKHGLPLVFVDEFIGGLFHAVLACLFDRASLPPEKLLFLIKTRVPDELKAFVHGWMYCNPTGRGSQIISRYLNGLSRGYMKVLSRKQRKQLQKESIPRNRYIMLRKGLRVIARECETFLQQLHSKSEALYDLEVLHPLSKKSQLILKNWLKEQLRYIQNAIGKNGNKLQESEVSLSMIKEKYDALLRAGTCASLLGKSPKIVTRTVPAFELFSAYHEFMEAGLCKEVLKNDMRALLEKFESFLNDGAEKLVIIQECFEHEKHVILENCSKLITILDKMRALLPESPETDVSRNRQSIPRYTPNIKGNKCSQ